MEVAKAGASADMMFGIGGTPEGEQLFSMTTSHQLLMPALQSLMAELY